ncbi:MAG TPA: CAP domain-containing protein [Actinomycetes bacterium]|nr:CAP domain-containing protein [Actinomycetes bacterium]
MVGQRRHQRRGQWLTLVCAFVLVGSLSVSAGYQLHGKLISTPGDLGGRSAVVEQSASPTGVGDRSAPERQQETVADDASAGSSPSSAPAPTESTKPKTQTDRRTAIEASVVKLTNSARAKAGCSALRTDRRLRTAARSHSTDMAKRDYFSHETPEGVTPWQRAEDAGYANPSAENIAHGYPTAKTVVDAWMASAGHRANILNCESKAVGVGVYLRGDGGPYWTQLFGYS